MRALLVGIGGAGCRIVETLNSHDERSQVKSVRSFVFDADTEVIHSMKSLEVKRRVVLSPSDPTMKDYSCGDDFDLTSISDCFQEEGMSEIDAIFVCAGLGGRMADLVPRFMEQLENAFPDPVFTILTLPFRSEGAKVSARAAEQLEAIRQMGSASIIFDNETWAGRIETEAAAAAAELNAEGLPKPLTRRQTSDLYDELNEMLARRVGLLLRAGEVTHNGVESAEVVLDAGEVLNTLTGMDIVSIGYATEKLPTNISGMFKKMFVEKYMLDEGHKRTSRIIDLAKQAVYEEVSVPCDLTSAEKALVLIAGPSEELSMKGFHMVRKWIDNSIRGLEMRAGDYPVKSTKYVGVIIVLAGIQNVPRVAELEEIYDSYHTEVEKIYGFEEIEEEIPLISIASDDSIFEPGEVLPPGEYLNVLPETIYEDDIEEDMTEYEYTEDDDLFEEVVHEIRKPAPQAEYVWEPESAPAPTPAPKQPRKRDPQISLGGAKRAERPLSSNIALPKREKHEDMVLSGMADLGRKDMPKDSESAVHIGGVQRPKENDDVQIAKVQRPRDIDRAVKIGSTQRPKDSDGNISAGSRQRPKDDDGRIRVTRVPMPKDYGEQVKLSAKKKSNEEDTHKKSEFRWL
ncbi:hypothetical protein J6B78_00230 [Methanocorpusculum sp.]|nr:hypothetical protein [Methanocorpusculum sp.]